VDGFADVEAKAIWRDEAGGEFARVERDVQTVTGTGTYSVNPDCTGTYTVQISPLGLTAHGFFVIDHSGNEFQLIETDPGTVVTGVVRRQFPVVRRQEEQDPRDDRKQ
jgi:hypothetical protein